mmetsp:Transcript_11143/g.20053  ORF Transcript_11143/g.20053 Transcript_11143/m.20053 type:complete len:127 (+) Transcript_11143:892-1272(+)
MDKHPIKAGDRKIKDGGTKRNATRRRGRKVKSLALLALTEQEELEKKMGTHHDFDNSNVDTSYEKEKHSDSSYVSSKEATELNAAKKRGRKGKSLALALALAEEEELENKVDTSNNREKDAGTDED